jgi:hypothetical protein
MVKPLQKMANSADSFGAHAFEGEGNAFLRKAAKETHDHRSLNIIPKIPKVQSQCVRVMLSGIQVHINCRFGSSGLNLVYEGLLLGMWNGTRRVIPSGAPPHVEDLRQ